MDQNNTIVIIIALGLYAIPILILGIGPFVFALLVVIIKQISLKLNTLSLFSQRWAMKNIIYFKRKPLKGLGLSQFIYRKIGKV